MEINITQKMKITENLTPEKGALSSDDTLVFYDLGTIPRNTPVNFGILFKDALHKSTRYGCGSCTTGHTYQKENDVQVDITYNARDLGVFSKTVTETFQDGTEQKIKFNGKTV